MTQSTGGKRTKLQTIPNPTINECPPTVKDYTGFEYGHVKVIGFSRQASRQTFWVVECSCGNRHEKQRKGVVHGARCPECVQKSHSGWSKYGSWKEAT